MADERIRVGLVGCGGISSLYTSIYAGLVNIAQVVAVADLVDELAEHRRQVLSDAYAAEAHTARVAAAEARDAATRAGTAAPGRGSHDCRRDADQEVPPPRGVAPR